ncbi:DUF445 domain-containing protein [Paenibacillus sp. GSMTC-2017]|uniref:DUF445 domain-containing protein n=1 Tax=Paenibacillus sp. GSMTC-2017 TaxID=2794350 RepID=UPI0018D6E26D|nr:DUF445 domain-containing protein [Paenibacillus sp. GSMTC-2017]MBH5317051.1 DUF445 domain-containing protein [Paenibacillus sp. GSMTC-2017]
MEKWSIRKKANGFLILSAIGILAAFPFQHTIVGGLLFAAFSAGTIGGLADTFAINALFGDPLRIKWPRWMGTHIISRNRERLIGELVDMVESELLTVASIRETLEDHDLATVIVRYLKEHGGADDLHIISQKLTSELLGKVDAEELASGIHRFLVERGDALQVSDILADIADWTIRKGYDDRMTTFIIHQFVKLIKSNQFRMIIEQLVQSAIRSYEGDKFRRRLVDFTAGLNANSISGRVQDWLVRFLEQVACEEHPQRVKFKEMLLSFTERLRTDDELRFRIESGKIALIHTIKDNVGLNHFLRKRIEALREGLLVIASERSSEHSKIQSIHWLREWIDKGIHQLSERSDLKSELDRSIKNMLMSWVQEKHAFIGQTVKEKLNAFSEEEFGQLVKEKAGKDLQYIRLNGMIVGAAVGTLLYTLTFWIGGV